MLWIIQQIFLMCYNISTKNEFVHIVHFIHTAIESNRLMAQTSVLINENHNFFKSWKKTIEILRKRTSQSEPPWFFLIKTITITIANHSAYFRDFSDFAHIRTICKTSTDSTRILKNNGGSIFFHASHHGSSTRGLLLFRARVFDAKAGLFIFGTHPFRFSHKSVGHAELYQFSKWSDWAGAGEISWIDDCGKFWTFSNVGFVFGIVLFGAHLRGISVFRSTWDSVLGYFLYINIVVWHSIIN